MEALRDRPLFTRVYENPDGFRPESNSAYLYGVFEERSEHLANWSTDPAVRKVRIDDHDRNVITIEPGVGKFTLRNRADLQRLLTGLGTNHVYVDITGLSHHVWAPMVRVALEQGMRINVVYVEPHTYRTSATPRKGEIFDLSERIEGISPLPLFASLTDAHAEQFCFIPLLGFEGTRLAHMIENVEPPGGKIVPVVGVPGFQVEYPFYTYLGNEPQLEATKAWKNVRYARANCPFSLYYTLEDILREYPHDHIKIALIGTKPHALGAVLLSTASSRKVELIYDHPRRKKQRTTGAAHLLEYAVSEFLPNVAPSR